MTRVQKGGFRLRPLIFWPHLIVGITAGLVILVMSVTGVLLTYQRQILLWAERDYRAAPAAGAARLPVSRLAEIVAAAYPPPPNPTPGAAAGISTVTIRHDDAMPVQFGVNGKTVSVNPYTGAVLGEGATGWRQFFRNVTNWHRWLAVDGEHRATARAITGASNLIFVLLAVSGLYLWWPRHWSLAALRNITIFRRGLTPKARDFNWHHVFGFWMAIPIVIIAGSAVVMSYGWANTLLYRLAGEKPPVAQQQRAGDGERRGALRQEGARAPIDDLIATATTRENDWTTISFRWPATTAPIAFTIDRGNGGQPHLKSTLTLNAQSGNTDKYEHFADQTRGRRWRAWTRWLHTGEAGGLWGQTLAGLASFAGVVLVYSGFALSWRRFFTRRRRKSDLDIAA